MTSDQRAMLERIRANAEHVLFPSQVAALTAALGTCATCTHHDDTAVLLPSLVTYCTHRLSNYNGLLMERTTRCARFEQQATEREATA